MSKSATWSTWPGSRTNEGKRPIVLSTLFGAAFTLFLFLAIAHFAGEPLQNTPRPEPLHAVVLPVEPPPPPPLTSAEPEADVAPLAGFALAPSDSTIKIAASPSDPVSILPEDWSRMPPPDAHFRPLLTNFRPKFGGFGDPGRVYDPRDVDQSPSAIVKTAPIVDRSMFTSVDSLSAGVLGIVEPDGTISGARVEKSSGNEQFDREVLKIIHDWRFSPAVKHGRKVRCLVEQHITINNLPGSPFGR